MKTKLSVGRSGLGPPGSSTIEAPVTRALASVYARTGIADLDLFLQKLANW